MADTSGDNLQVFDNGVADVSIEYYAKRKPDGGDSAHLAMRGPDDIHVQIGVARLMAQNFQCRKETEKITPTEYISSVSKMFFALITGRVEEPKECARCCGCGFVILPVGLGGLKIEPCPVCGGDAEQMP